MASVLKEGAEGIELLSNQGDEDEKKYTRGSCLYTGLGYAGITMDVLLLSTSIMCAQALGGLVPPLELNGWRYTAQFIIAVSVINFKRLNIFLKRQEVMWVLLVACCSVLFNVFFYTAATYLPVGTVGGVQASLVILICGLVTAVLNRKCASTFIIACLMCVAGVLLVTQPPFLFKKSGRLVYHPLCGPLSWAEQALANNTTFSYEETENEFFNSGMESKMQSKGVTVGIGYICLLGSAIGTSTQLVVIKQKLSETSVFVISFWVSIVGVVSQFLIMAVLEKPVLPKTPICIGLLLAHASCAAGGNLFGVLGGQLISPALASLVLSQDVVVLFGAQYTILRTVYPGRENWIEFLGAALVLLGNVVNPALEILSRWRQNYKQMN